MPDALGKANGNWHGHSESGVYGGTKPKKRVVTAKDPTYRDVLINLNFKDY